MRTNIFSLPVLCGAISMCLGSGCAMQHAYLKNSNQAYTELEGMKVIVAGADSNISATADASQAPSAFVRERTQSSMQYHAATENEDYAVASAITSPASIVQDHSTLKDLTQPQDEQSDDTVTNNKSAMWGLFFALLSIMSLGGDIFLIIGGLLVLLALIFSTIGLIHYFKRGTTYTGVSGKWASIIGLTIPLLVCTIIAIMAANSWG